EQPKRRAHGADVKLVCLHRGYGPFAYEGTEQPVPVADFGRIRQPALERHEPLRAQAASPDGLHAAEVDVPVGLAEFAQHGGRSTTPHAHATASARATYRADDESSAKLSQESALDLRVPSGTVPPWTGCPRCASSRSARRTRSSR